MPEKPTHFEKLWNITGHNGVWAGLNWLWITVASFISGGAILNIQAIPLNEIIGWASISLGFLVMVVWFVLQNRRRNKNSPKSDKKEILIADKATRPLLEISCGDSVDKSVVKQNGYTFFRARIQTRSQSAIKNVRARLNSMQSLGKRLPLPESVRLKFHPGHSDTVELLCSGAEEFVDVVAVDPSGRAFFHSLPTIPGADALLVPGSAYDLAVAFTTETEGHVDYVFRFTWTGDASRSGCRILTDQNKAQEDLISSAYFMSAEQKPMLSYSRQSVARLADTIDKRLVAVQEGVSQGVSFQDLADRFTTASISGTPIKVPMVHTAEAALIEECNSTSHYLQWDEFRKIATLLVEMNSEIERYNDAPTLDRANSLLRKATQEIPPITVRIRAQMLSRFAN